MEDHGRPLEMCVCVCGAGDECTYVYPDPGILRGMHSEDFRNDQELQRKNIQNLPEWLKSALIEPKESLSPFEDNNIKRIIQNDKGDR